MSDPADDAYLALFLSQEDLPGMLLSNETHDKLGPDEAFTFYGGVRRGKAMWMGNPASPVGLLIDIRWLFPDEQQALAYHLVMLNINSEGTPVAPNAPPAGQECVVFGGTRELEPGNSLTAFLYLFRVGNVVVKLFAAHGQWAADNSLTPEAVGHIAARAASRIEARLHPD